MAYPRRSILIVIAAVLSGLIAAKFLCLLPDLKLMDFRHRSAAPTLVHPLGTDRLGRDLLARLAEGSQWSILEAFSATLFALFFGSILTPWASRSPSIRRVLSITSTLLFVALAFLFGSSWTSRLVASLLFALGIFPAFWLGLASIAVLGHGAKTGPIFFGLLTTPLLPKFANRQAIVGGAVRAMVGTTSLFAWSLIWTTDLALLSLGAAPQVSTWGSIAIGGSLLEMLCCLIPLVATIIAASSGMRCDRRIACVQFTVATASLWICSREPKQSPTVRCMFMLPGKANRFVTNITNIAIPAQCCHS